LNPHNTVQQNGGKRREVWRGRGGFDHPTQFSVRWLGGQRKRGLPSLFLSMQIRDEKRNPQEGVKERTEEGEAWLPPFLLPFLAPEGGGNSKEGGAIFCGFSFFLRKGKKGEEGETSGKKGGESNFSSSSLFLEEKLKEKRWRERDLLLLPPLFYLTYPL